MGSSGSTSAGTTFVVGYDSTLITKDGTITARELVSGATVSLWTSEGYRPGSARHAGRADVCFIRQGWLQGTTIVKGVPPVVVPPCQQWDPTFEPSQSSPVVPVRRMTASELMRYINDWGEKHNGWLIGSMHELITMQLALYRLGATNTFLMQVPGKRPPSLMIGKEYEWSGSSNRRWFRDLSNGCGTNDTVIESSKKQKKIAIVTVDCSPDTILAVDRYGVLPTVPGASRTVLCCRT